MPKSNGALESAVASSDSREIFAGPELKHWAEEEGLYPPEKFLLGQYFHSDRSTLEAGTGGGRILRALAHRGFTELSGFDNVPELIHQAGLKEPSQRMAFSVQDARMLTYADSSFEQLIYLQQVLCFITDAEGRQKAVSEAYRILKPGGVALFSFLSMESRLQSALYRTLIGYLCCFRTLTRRQRSQQHMPWLWVANRFNISALLDRAPYAYWYRCEEAANLLLHQQFRILGIGTRTQTDQKRFCESLEDFRRSPKGGMLYIVCQK
jgi:SAM-dependent methyltransferase